MPDPAATPPSSQIPAVPAVPRPRVLFTDFDGTFVRRDFYEIVSEQIIRQDCSADWAEFLAGRVSHFDALQRIFARIRATPEVLAAATVHMDADPASPAAISRLRAAGWEVVIVSAGCRWYVERVLDRLGILVAPGSWRPAAAPSSPPPNFAARPVVHVISNGGGPTSDGGFQMIAPAEEPWFAASTGVDKAKVVALAQEAGAEIAGAGDGVPDRAMVLPAPPQQRFARGWLGNRLREEGEAFVSFDRWSEVAAHLTRDSRSGG